MHRYSVILACVLAVMALPVHATAQGTDEGAAPRVVEPEAPQAAEPVGSRLELWHPEAFTAPPDKSEVEINYVPAEPEERTLQRRRRAIALGVVIPLVALGLGLGITAGVVMSNWD